MSTALRQAPTCSVRDTDWLSRVAEAPGLGLWPSSATQVSGGSPIRRGTQECQSRASLGRRARAWRPRQAVQGIRASRPCLGRGAQARLCIGRGAGSAFLTSCSAYGAARLLPASGGGTPGATPRSFLSLLVTSSAHQKGHGPISCHKCLAEGPSGRGCGYPVLWVIPRATAPLRARGYSLSQNPGIL